MDILEHVEDYDPTIPKPKFGFQGFKWSLVFLLDYTFSLANQKDSEGNEIPKYESSRWAGKSYKKLHERLVEKLIKQNSSPYEGPLTIPTIDSKHANAAFFSHWAKKMNMPIVLKGFLKEEKIMDLTTIESLVENHGDREVKFVRKEAYDKNSKKFIDGVQLKTTSLGEFLTNDKHKNDYLNNFYGVLDDEDYKVHGRGNELDEYCGMTSAFAQWYISRVELSGSPLHCALGDNMFLNIQGNKEWLFVHPDYLPIFKPTMDPLGVYVISELQEEIYGNSDVYSDLVRDYPYLKHVPIFRYRLEPGDVLYNPSCWWHNVRNFTDYTVGCAVRYPAKQLDYNSVTLSLAGLLIATIKNPTKSILIEFVRMLRGNSKTKKSFIKNLYKNS